jgi:AraC-like DNA-binding protein
MDGDMAAEQPDPAPQSLYVTDPMPHAPSHAEIERIVWRLLEDRPGTRPTIADVGRAVGRSPLQLRRAIASDRRESNGSNGSDGSGTLRMMLTSACIAYAGTLVKRGEKVEAAMFLSGFRHKTNFGRQFRRQFGCLPSQYRNQRA